MATAGATAGKAAAATAPAHPPVLSLPDSREARRMQAMRLLFLIGLMAWGSLAGWWATFFYRSSLEVRHWTLRAYATEEKLAAENLVRDRLDPTQAEAALHGTVFTLATAPLSADEGAYPSEVLAGRLAGRTLVVNANERLRLKESLRRKMIMLAGEGSLLVGLLFLCLLILYRMLMGELELRRQQESFVHAVTHELRSPLTGLRSLLQSFGSLEIPKIERVAYVDLGLREIERLDQLVSNILLSSRLEAAAYRPQIVAVDVAATLRRARESRQPVFTDRGGDVQVAAPETLAARADPEALDLILRNLVDNALKYTAGKPVVTLTARRDGKAVFIDVRDQGIGLSAEEQARLFRKFYRAPAGELRQAKGSGLGLFLARGLARSFGGDLTVRSAGVGQGSTFTVRLEAS